MYVNLFDDNVCISVTMFTKKYIHLLQLSRSNVHLSKNILYGPKQCYVNPSKSTEDVACPASTEEMHRQKAVLKEVHDAVEVDFVL